MSLAALQTSIADALRAAPAFAGLAVIEDDGTTERDQERELSTKGAVLVVSPALGMRRRTEARVSFEFVAVFAVHLRTMPAVNFATGGAGIVPQDALEHILAAVVIAHRLANGTRDIVVPSAEFADLVQEDSGLSTYTALFEASVIVSAKP